MQSAGMLRVRTGTICLLVLTIGLAYGLPLQFLPSIPGYIPVYIRNGDQPLIEVNPALAEAFHETENYSKTVRNLKLDQIPKITEKTSSKSREKIEEEKDSKRTSINKIKEAEKKDLKTVEKEETKENGVFHSNSKAPSDPEEVQFIKVSIMSDSSDHPIVRKAKSPQINDEEIKKPAKNINEAKSTFTGLKVLEKIYDDDDTQSGGKDLHETRPKDLTDKNDDALIK